MTIAVPSRNAITGANNAKRSHTSRCVRLVPVSVLLNVVVELGERVVVVDVVVGLGEGVVVVVEVEEESSVLFYFAAHCQDSTCLLLAGIACT